MGHVSGSMREFECSFLNMYRAVGKRRLDRDEMKRKYHGIWPKSGIDPIIDGGMKCETNECCPGYRRE